MAILRASAIRELSEKELDERLADLRKDLMKIRGVLASGGMPEDVGKAREIRHTIARILTIKKEKLSKKEAKKVERLDNKKK
jgi:large subunit ribosomal protein L29